MKFSNNKKLGLFSIDPLLFFPAFILTGIGLVMIYSASSSTALKLFRDEYFYFKHQFAYAGAGMVAMVLGYLVSYRFYRVLVYPLILISVVLLCLVYFPGLGHTAGGATRWIDLKWFNFQPSVLARFSLILFMAYSLDKKEENVERFSIGFAPHVLLASVFTVLIYFEPDFGSIVIFWVLTWIIMFGGRARILHLLGTLVPLVLIGIVLLMTKSYRLTRLFVFLDPWKYPKKAGYQIIHSFMAFGSGGMLGKGFGLGVQKLFYLPTPHTDFILSVIAEEGGFVLVFFIILLFLVMLWRGIFISISVKETFGALLAFGIIISLTLQAVFNMGVVTGLLPTKGLTLPFLSYGGSALVFDLFCIGILMNISRRNEV